MSLREISSSGKIYFTPVVLNADGSVFKVHERQRNLILDQGLNCLFGTGGSSYTRRNWAGAIDNARYGTGTDPFIRDAGAVTFTASGGVVTASAGFFDATDVGRLLRLSTGESGYITSFTSATAVNWGGPDVGSGQTGKVYYVNRTGLQTHVAATRTFRNSGGDNGTAWTDFANGIIRHKKSYLFASRVSPVTVREVGWGFSASLGGSDGPLFGGAVLTSPVDLLVGQQLLLVLEMFVRWSPMVSTIQSNVGDGMDTSGTVSLRAVQASDFASFVQETGHSGGGGLDDFGNSPASYGPSIAFITASFIDGNAAQSSFTVTSINKNATMEAYVNGNFYAIVSAEIGVSEGNGNIFGFGLIYASDMRLAHRFATAQPKTNEHKMIARFRYSANRDFT